MNQLPEETKTEETPAVAAEGQTPAAEETKTEETPAPAAEGQTPAAEGAAAEGDLSEVKVVTNEENEETLFKVRAKLFRFAKETSEWKERGVGDVKFLKHKESGKIRVLMRREKTLKICANHYILPAIKLETNAGSDRSWVWTAYSDVSDEEAGVRDDVLAIRFANSENATKFKEEFEKCQAEMEKLSSDKKE